MTTKCECPNHLSKATSQSDFCFTPILFFPWFQGPKRLKRCLRFAIFHCSKKLQNIFEMGFKECRVIVQKLLSKKKYFEINNSQTTFCSWYVKLTTVQIWGQLNKFPLSYNALVSASSKQKLFKKTALRKIFCFANKLCPQIHLAGFSYNWANQCRESSLLFTTTSWWIESPKNPCVLQYVQGTEGREIIFL